MLICVPLEPYINSKSVVLKKPLNVDHFIIFTTVTTSVTLFKGLLAIINKKQVNFFYQAQVDLE